jgi:hypothetical protein
VSQDSQISSKKSAVGGGKKEKKKPSSNKPSFIRGGMNSST